MVVAAPLYVSCNYYSVLRTTIIIITRLTGNSNRPEPLVRENKDCNKHRQDKTNKQRPGARHYTNGREAFGARYSLRVFGKEDREHQCLKQRCFCPFRHVALSPYFGHLAHGSTSQLSTTKDLGFTIAGAII